MKLLPYNMNSKSAKALASALKCRRVYPDRKFKNPKDELIINWGFRGSVAFPVSNWLNQPSSVSLASNKLYALTTMRDFGVPVPDFSDDPSVAEEWDDCDILARYELHGHSGSGIRYIGKHESVHSYDIAPLYVKYIKKKDEYRFHVFNGEVIDIQQKRKRRDIDNDEVNYQIRNHSNGFIYARDDVYPHCTLADLARDAVEALGLDFGAVDIIWNERHGKGYVLEVNTACGLEGSTLDIYKNAIIRFTGFGLHPYLDAYLDTSGVTANPFTATPTDGGLFRE